MCCTVGLHLSILHIKAYICQCQLPLHPIPTPLPLPAFGNHLFVLHVHNSGSVSDRFICAMFRI